MASAASRIAVEVTANSTDLQASVAKAADSLKGLGDVLAKQSKAAITQGDLTIRNNREVALSYEAMARAASTSTAKAAVSYKGMTEASKASAAQTAKTADMQKLLAAQTKAAEVQMLRSTQALRKDVEAHTTHQNALQRTGTSLDNAGRKMQNFGHLMAPVSLGLLAVGVYSIKAAQTFQAEMTRIQTQAGATGAEVNRMTKYILNLAPAVDIGPNELAKGLFHVESAGIRGAEAMRTLDAAAKGAAIGQANLEDVTNTLVGVLRTHIGGVHGAADAMDQLNAIIGEGNLRMQDLTAAFGTGFALTAKQVGIPLKDLGAALDEMTQKGIPAAKAATSLRFALLNMAAPTKAGQKALEEIGIKQGELAEDLRRPDGLRVAVTDLNEHMQKMGLSATKQTELLKSAFGGIRSSAAILTLTQDLGGFNNILTKLGGNQGTKDFEEKFKKTSETSAFKWHQMTATIESDSIKMGITLLPIANTIIGDVTKMVDGFTKLPTPVKDAAVGIAALGAVLAPVALAMGTVTRLAGSAFKVAGATGGPFGKIFGGTAGISGARTGGMGPGSAANPIVTVMEDAQYAGLGGRAAPLGTSGATTAGTAAKSEASSIGTKVAAGGRAVLGRALGAAGVLGIGLGASEIAGQAIGGHTGSTVSSIGTTATLGAAIGTAIEPGLGTAIGGLGGAIVGAIKAIAPPSQAVKEAHEAAEGRGKPKLGPQFKAEAEHLFAEQAKAVHAAAPRGGQAQLEKANAMQVRETMGGLIGEAQGKAEAAYVQEGKRFPGLQSIIETSKRDLAQLAPAGKEAFMKMMTGMVQTLEREGRLPAGSLKRLVDAAKKELSHLPIIGTTSADGFSKNFIANLHTSDMQAAVVKVSQEINHNWGREFGLLPVTTHMHFDEVVQTSYHDLARLKGIMQYGTKQQREAAEQEYAQLAPGLHKYMEAAKGAVATELTSLGQQTGPLSHKGVEAIIKKYEELPPAMKTEMEHAGGAIGKGMDAINKALEAELKALGVTWKGKLSTQQLIQQMGVTTVTGGTGAGGHAMGGFIGAAGERGRDEVPAMLGRGEAVLNYQQQAVADRALAAAGHGGLDQLFTNTAGTRHYMASGGYAGYSLPLPRGSMMPGSWSIDQGVDIPAGAGTPEYAIGPGTIIGEGISGFGPNAPILKISAGPLAGMNVYYGHAGPDVVRVGQTVHAGQQISEVGSGIVGISTGPHIEIGFGPPFSTGQGMAVVLQQLMGHAGVSGVPGGIAATPASIGTPRWTGPGGAIGQAGQAVLAKSAAAANAFLAKMAPQGIGAASVAGQPLGAAGAGSWRQEVSTLSKQKGWSEHDWLEIIAAESGSPGQLGTGNPQAVERGSGAFGLGQVLGATRTQFPKMTSSDGATQIVGMAEYIASRYGDPTRAWAFHVANNYYATGKPKAHFPGTKPKVPGAKTKPLKPKAQKPGTKVKAQTKPLSPKQLQTLDQLRTGVEGPWNDAQTLTTQMGNLQQLFQAQEGEEAYLNPDGSLNAAGIAKKATDDRELIGMQQRVLGDYNELLPLVSHALSTELGKESNLEGKINKDTAQIAKDNKTIALNKEKIASLRAVSLALKKPTPDVVKAIQAQITGAKAHWDPLVKAAQAAKAGYVPQTYVDQLYQPPQAPKGKAGEAERAAQYTERQRIASLNQAGHVRVTGLNQQERARLEAAVRAVKGEEESILRTLRAALARAKAEQAAHKLHVSLESFHLGQKIQGYEKEDLTLSNKDKGLSETDKQLKEALGGQAGAGTALGVIENIAGQLGTVAWDSAGHFVGINTADQGAAFSAGIQLISLQNDLAGVYRSAALPETAATSTENTQLIQLLQQQNTQLAEAYALSQAQFKVLSTFAPNIPHFASGGPVLNDGLIYAHAGEHVVPAQGTLVRDSAQKIPEVHNHFTVQGSMAPLIDIIDQRVQHPDNARHISTHIGRRTSMLAGAPGGFR
jgi:TP901 family phage tail tape measure protein